jgi:hypothetical protein
MLRGTLIAVLAAFSALAGCAAHSVARGAQGGLDIRLRAPRAQSVVLVVAGGEAFEQFPASPDRLGTWRVSLKRAGEFRYFYLVDGKPFLPECGLREKDDFGAVNCIFAPYP